MFLRSKRYFQVNNDVTKFTRVFKLTIMFPSKLCFLVMFLSSLLPNWAENFEISKNLTTFSVWQYWNENHQTADKSSSTIYRRGITWPNEITKRISRCENFEFQRERSTSIISCYRRWSDSISSILSSLQSYDKEHGFITINLISDWFLILENFRWKGFSGNRVFRGI